MSKALVIKDVDFSANKVATISFGDEVPCTGLSLSDSTYAFTAIGTTKTLTATKTPENTTDALTWASSDENVATVADGVVTCTGVGSATITATCGTQTATCSITSTVTVDANSAFTSINGYNISSTDLTANPPKDYAGVTSKAGGRIYGSDDALTYRAFSTSNSAFDDVYPIPVPNGTKQIVFQFPTKFVRLRFQLLKSTENHTYNTGVDSAKVVFNTGMINVSGGSHTIDISSESGFDSMVFNLEATSYNADTVTGDVTVTFS